MKNKFKLTSVIFITLFLMLSNTSINANTISDNTNNTEEIEKVQGEDKTSDNIINLSQGEFVNSLENVSDKEIDEQYMKENNLEYAIGKTSDGNVVYSNVSKKDIISLNKGNKNAGYNVGSNTWKKGVSSTLIVRLEMAGIGPVFCISPSAAYPTGQNYDAGSVYADPGVQAILWYGFPSNVGGDRPGTWDDNDAYNATYLALNAYLYPNGFSMHAGGYVMTRAWLTSKGDTYLNTLVQRGINGTVPNVNVYVNNPPVTEAYYDEATRENISNWFFVGGGDYVEISNLPQNVYLQSEDGIKHHNGGHMTTNQHYHVRTKDLNFKGTVTPIFTSNIRLKAAIIFRSAGVQSLVASGYREPIIPQSRSATFVDTTSRVEMSKIDADTKEVIPGAVFELFSCNANKENCTEYVNETIQHIKVKDENGNEVNDLNKTAEGKIEIPNILNPGVSRQIDSKQNYYVSSGGKIILENVPIGVYALKEIVSPEGYNLNGNFIFVEVKAGSTVIELSAPNTEITSSITLVKKDVDTNEVLKGAVFELLKYDFTTKTYEPYYNERISQSLQEVGSTKPNPKPLDLKIDSNGNVLISELQDNQLVEVPKEFKNNYYITSGGYLNLHNIPYGAYALREIYEPFGHILNNELIPFNVSEDKAKITLEFRNKEITSSISLSKVDSKTRENVEGAVFELLRYDFTTKTYEPYVNKRITNTINSIGNTKPLKRPLDLQFDKSGKVLIPKIKNHEIKYDPMLYKENYYTSKNGIIHLNDVPYGVYALREIYSPMGYLLSEELLPFNVTEDSAKIELEFPNTEITSTIKFSKVDSFTNEILPGAKMTIEKYNFKTLKWEYFLNFTTVDTESIIENVAYGTYRVNEIQAPSGYILKDLNLMFDVNEEGAVITLEYPNPKLPKTGETDVTLIFILISGVLVLSRKLIY